MEKKDNEGQRLTRVSNMTGEVGGVDACQVSSRQGNKAREVNCCCVFSSYILKQVLSGRCL